MIKVLHVVSDMNIGGAGKVVINLLKATLISEAKTEAKIKVVIPKGSRLKDALVGADVADIADIIEAQGMADKTISLAGIFSLLKIFVAEKPHIVHTHAGLSARIAARLIGAKVVFTRHWKGQTSVSGLGKLMNNCLCDIAFAVSKTAYASLVETGISKDKIVLLHNGVEGLKKDESRTLLKDLNISDKIVIGTAARLEPVKNLACLLKAAVIIKSRRDDVIFLIAGEGSLEAELKSLADELELGDRVKFLGFVSDMGRFMSALDVNVLCSLEEAFPLSVLEAMSVGVPTIASRCGGTEEQIDNGINGILVDVNNPEALAEGILRLTESDSLRKSMGEAALLTYRNNFGAKTFANETIKVYKTLLAKK